MSALLGVSIAAPSFLPETAEYEIARHNFIREYNRLAKLAADAPDIHIIMSDDLNDPRILAQRQQQQELILQQQPQPQPQQHQVPVVTHSAPIPFRPYSFTANLGGNSQFRPTSDTFPGL